MEQNKTKPNKKREIYVKKIIKIILIKRIGEFIPI
jgi:hypothetical protein